MSRLAGSPIGVELLDDPAADPAAVRLSLLNIARANRLFGGWLTLRRGLQRLLAGHHPGALSLLDVGTGAGDLPLRARAWAARRGITLHPIGIDQHHSAAKLARDAGLPAAIACGSQLPFGDRSVDIVTLSQVAHHLAPAALAAMCREVTRVARIGVVLADLRPSLLGGVAYQLAGPLLRFDHFTVSDGVTSLQRGFSPDRLARALRAAGIEAWIRPLLGVRIVATWRADGTAA